MSDSTSHKLIWIYPNTSNLNRGGRGGFLARERYREGLGFDLVEMPTL